jgi:sarcosine oxidase subunit gamma
VSDLLTLLRQAMLVTSELVAPRQLVSVIARRGCAEQVQARVVEQFGLALPLQPQAGATGNGSELAFLWSGPGHWLAMSNAADARGLEEQLSERLDGVASVCDQSGSRVMFSVQGPNARMLLAKGLGVDLHPQNFAPNDVAVSSIGHMGVQLWQVDAAPTYRLLVARSYAESFRHWLRAAGG